MPPNHLPTNRKIFGRPVLLQDWDEEADESGAAHWQLFLDLLLVAAASSIADGFKSELTLSSFCEFAVLYVIIVDGWMLYTHDICSRFQDASFSHAMVLLVYCLGFGTSSVNVSPGWTEAPGFAIGALILRGALMLMLTNIACCLPNARYTAQCIAIIVGLASVGLVVAVIFNVDPMFVQLGLLWAAAIEFFGRALIVSFGQIQQVVPVSIDHTKERLGALILTMMGETVLSVTISFRELDEDGVIPQENRHLEYWVLGLSFLLIFMFLLLYFHLQPSPSEIALLRTQWHGIALMHMHKVLGLALLSVGVCIKVVVEAVLLKEGEDDFSSFVGYLFGTSVGAALFTLYLIRLLHYQGKQTIHFGHRVYTRGENPYVDRMIHAWRHTLLCASLLPVIGMATGLTMNDPLMATALYAGLVFAMICAEVFFTRAIEKQIPEPVLGEQQPLVSSS